MEIKEYQPIPNFKERFNELPFNGQMEFPMSMLTPIISDDYKQSETKGPLSVFIKGDKYYIDDGNHRFFEVKRKLSSQNDYKESDLNKFFIPIKKIDPQKAINRWMFDY